MSLRLPLAGALIATLLAACAPANETVADCLVGESRGCQCDDGMQGALVCGEQGFFLPCARDGAVCVASATVSDPDASGTDTGTSSDVDSPDTAPPPPGPAVACAFDGLEAIATLIEGPGVDNYPVTFWGDGGIRTVAGAECEYSGDDSSADRCIDTYTCAGCSLRLFGDPDSFVLTSGSAQDACDALGVAGAYSVDACTRSCDGRSCGDDGCGGSCGTCPFDQMCASATGKCFEDPCTVCVRECPRDLGVNCCTCGASCYCGSACASTCPP